MTIKPPPRKFLPSDFKITDWPSLQLFFDGLEKRPIASASDLRHWLLDRSELESVVSEDMGWRYIRMTCYTENEQYNKAYQYFVQEIQPHMAPYSDRLNKKVMDSPFVKELEQVAGYDIMLRNLKKEIEIDRKSVV